VGLDVRAFLALTSAGFRRWSTYRQATAAAVFTNSVFGFLKTYVLLAVALGAGGAAVGYDGPMLVSFVWLGQGLIGVVMLWGWTDLADRVRTGDVVADLLRPVNPLWTYLAADLGRAGYATLTRFLIPVAVGLVYFDFFLPTRPASYALFTVSVALAVLVSFTFRYLVNLTAFWLLDVRGVMLLAQLMMGALSGLYLPIRFLPDWCENVLWYLTPFPSMLQAPLDIYVEYGGIGTQLAIVSGQLAWVVVGFTACGWLQRRAAWKLVIQGG